MLDSRRAARTGALGPTSLSRLPGSNAVLGTAAGLSTSKREPAPRVSSGMLKTPRVQQPSGRKPRITALFARVLQFTAKHPHHRTARAAQRRVSPATQGCTGDSRPSVSYSGTGPQRRMARRFSPSARIGGLARAKVVPYNCGEPDE